MKKSAEEEASVPETQPDWYKRAETGPFDGNKFTPLLMSKVEHSAAKDAERRMNKPRRRRNAAIWAGGAAVVLVLGSLGWNSGLLNDSRQLAGPVPTLSGAPVLGVLPEHSQLPSPVPAQMAAVPPEEAAASTAPAPSATALPPPGAAVFELGGTAYYAPLLHSSDQAFTQAALTSEGVVWSPAPARIENGNMDDHPTQPYSLYVSSMDQPELTLSSSQLIYTLPLTSRIAKAGKDAYMDLNKIIGLDSYVLFVTSAHLPGTAQASEEKLWVLDLREVTGGTAAEPKEIVSFHSAGGRMFTFGLDSQRRELVYIYSTPNGDGEYDKEAVRYLLDTGESKPLEAYLETAKGISYSVDGNMQKTDQIFR